MAFFDLSSLRIQRQVAAVCMLLNFFRLSVLAFEVASVTSSDSCPVGAKHYPRRMMIDFETALPPCESK